MFEILKRNKKLLIWLLILCFAARILVSTFGWNTDEAQQDAVEKQSFYIETQRIAADNWVRTEIVKNGKIAGTSELTITAQVPWRVEDIPSELGDVVAENTLVVQLYDTNGAYSFASQRAGLGVDSAKNTYQQQVENLEKQLSDAQLAYERAKSQSDAAIQDAEKQLEKAQYDLENSSMNEWSATSLQIAKLEKDLEKAEFDYETKRKSDEQTVDNFIATAKNIHNDVLLLMQDVVYETDKVLGITNQLRDINDAYENNLSATNTSQLNSAKDTFYALQWQVAQLKTYDAASISRENVEERLKQYQTFLSPVNTMLDSMEKVLLYTVTWPNLTQTQLDVLKAQFDGYQSRAQWTISSITAQLNSIVSFLTSYEDQQESLSKSVSLLEQQIEITQKSLEDAQFNTQIWLDRTQIWATNSEQGANISLQTAESALNFIINTKNTTLETIDNTRKHAELAYQESLANSAKFSVTSPIQWQVTDIFVDIGQDVTPGTPLIKIVSDQQEIEITMQENELDAVEVGQEVLIRSDEGVEVLWKLISKADAGDRNGNFKALVQLSENVLKVWTFADVILPVGKGITWVDINVVRIVDNGIWEIFLRNNGQIEKKTVELGSLLGNQIEIRTPLPATAEIILTNIEAYDPKTMNIIKK